MSLASRRAAEHIFLKHTNIQTDDPAAPWVTLTYSRAQKPIWESISYCMEDFINIVGLSTWRGGCCAPLIELWSVAYREREAS